VNRVNKIKNGKGSAQNGKTTVGWDNLLEKKKDGDGGENSQSVGEKGQSTGSRGDQFMELSPEKGNLGKANRIWLISQCILKERGRKRPVICSKRVPHGKGHGEVEKSYNRLSGKIVQTSLVIF